MGALLARHGIRIAAVAGRRRESALEAAEFIGAASVAGIGEAPVHARRILIAVSDDAVTQIASELAAGGLRNGIVLHTCGSMGPEALAPLHSSGNALGVLHPLQTVPSAERGVESLGSATFACAGDTEAKAWAEELICCLGGRGLSVKAEHWALYHAAAVMACNYHVALVDAALELLQQAGVGREQALNALTPLVRSTTENVLADGPEAALTGPIRRGDRQTIRRHMEAMKNAMPETRELYTAAGARTLLTAMRVGLSAEAAREIAEAFEECCSK